MAPTSRRHPYKAADVADYFIFLASQPVAGDSNEREGITNLKLQKILYFAQAYFLAKLGRPLFDDPIEAWELGPVVPAVYRVHSKMKSRPIFNRAESTKIDDEDKAHLRKVWESFGAYSASRLVDISHGHAPWQQASEAKNKTISVARIREYYKDLLS